MKTIKYFAMAIACVAFAACQGDWDEPTTSPYGNSSINDENIITIAQLKADYPNVFASSDQNVKIDKDIKIKGRVTGNDIGSNLYKQFTLQDETGAIIVAVNQSGMHGFLAEGQEIVIDLKDLYIGGYGKQPEIGQPYNGTSIGRMNKELFQQHFKYTGSIDANAIQPIDFDVDMDKDANCGKLVTLKNVSFALVAGLGTFAPDSALDKTVTIKAGCVNRALNEYSASDLVVRTSTYAKFAAKKLPIDEATGKPLKCNITGIATRYASGNKDTWQILIRKESDIEIIK
ncbi:DUF5689 domain-containing protein [Prevotella sp. E13-27]|uniref:DUF5689 domain-containing protein n=1 Tax=Prevotella sp. E13-27 TaxID=2938122 RepID=UPI00200ACAB2|nr:DUF5689 domain-containing protein [Prevotella sp. E13-27]MCK8622851.1 DUF5689 domain-containing protein [Prevotella sp. E13-27]